MPTIVRNGIKLVFEDLGGGVLRAVGATGLHLGVPVPLRAEIVQTRKIDDQTRSMS